MPSNQLLLMSVCQLANEQVESVGRCRANLAAN